MKAVLVQIVPLFFFLFVGQFCWIHTQTRVPSEPNRHTVKSVIAVMRTAALVSVRQTPGRLRAPGRTLPESRDEWVDIRSVGVESSPGVSVETPSLWGKVSPAASKKAAGKEVVYRIHEGSLFAPVLQEESWLICRYSLSSLSGRFVWSGDSTLAPMKQCGKDAFQHLDKEFWWHWTQDTAQTNHFCVALARAVRVDVKNWTGHLYIPASPSLL